jgi:type III secretion protein U
VAEKTHKPTPKRLRDARKRGEVVRSRDVSSLAAFVAPWICLGLGASAFWNHLSRLATRASTAADPDAQTFPWQLHLEEVIGDALWIVGPLLGASVVFGVLAGLLQTRGLVSFQVIAPKLERINPGQGLQNLFTVRQLIELGKALLKIILLVGAVFCFILAALDALVKEIYASVGEVLRLQLDLAWRLMGWSAVIYAVTAGLDYAHQFYEFMKKHKMSREDLRREHRDTEGDPRIRNRRRSLAREMSFQESLQRLDSAQVVVMNPTHIAVALQYVPGNTPLPKVVAKGTDAVALRMRARARRAGIPVLEDRLLARRLYREVPLDHYIKEELIDAVAAVFRWVSSIQLPVTETETNSPYGVNQPGEVGPIDLAAQPGDMHVDHVIERGSPPDVSPDLMR